jgi:hypothetical protein
METIIVGFSRNNKKSAIVGRLIRWAQGTPFSHTYIRFYSSKFDRWLVYQASKTAVNFMEYVHFLENNEVVQEFNIPISDEQKTELITFAIDTVGRPYSMKALIGLGLKELGININCLINSGDASYICSELVVRSLQDIEIATNFSNPDSVTPRELFEYLNNKY